MQYYATVRDDQFQLVELTTVKFQRPAGHRFRLNIERDGNLTGHEEEATAVTQVYVTNPYGIEYIFASGERTGSTTPSPTADVFIDKPVKIEVFVPHRYEFTLFGDELVTEVELWPYSHSERVQPATSVFLGISSNGRGNISKRSELPPTVTWSDPALVPFSVSQDGGRTWADGLSLPSVLPLSTQTTIFLISNINVVTTPGGEVIQPPLPPFPIDPSDPFANFNKWIDDIVEQAEQDLIDAIEASQPPGEEDEGPWYTSTLFIVLAVVGGLIFLLMLLALFLSFRSSPNPPTAPPPAEAAYTAPTRG